MSFAQSNPAPAACGLPAQGAISQNATYELSADCSQTGLLTLSASLTINGNGYKITFPSNRQNFIWGENASAVLNLNRVTLDGANARRTQPIRVETVNADQVTFTRSRPAALTLSSGTLSNVLFEWNLSARSSGGTPSTLLVGGSGNITLNNAVFRNNLAGIAAIELRAGRSITATGCLTFSGNAPYDYIGPGTFTDNSTGACSGTIGNGHQAAIAAPALMACGFPAAGNLDRSATYTLTADCELTGAYYISEDVNIGIIGSGRKISTSRSGYSFYTAATSSLRLENIALEGVRILSWGDLRANRIIMSDTVDGLINLGEMRFSKAVFENNRAGSESWGSVALAYNAYQKGSISFTDATFRDNDGGFGALATFGATIELNGCIFFENNSPADTFIYPGEGGVINDNRDPDCDSPITDPLQPPVVCNPHCDLPPAPPVKCNPHCDLPPAAIEEGCDLKLGAIGLICRPRAQPPVASVWRIRPNPEGTRLPAVGTFLLSVNQLQVEAVAEGLVACSADGRLAIRTGLTDELRQVFENSPQYDDELRVPRRYIVFSKGPEPKEGKVHNIVLDNALDGRVFGIVDTYGGPPAPECIKEHPAQPTPTPAYATPVQPQAAQPDGSIIHVVQLGDTVSGIAFAYRVSQLEIIMNNQLEDMGRWIYPGQALRIRAADA